MPSLGAYILLQLLQLSLLPQSTQHLSRPRGPSTTETAEAFVPQSGPQFSPAARLLAWFRYALCHPTRFDGLRLDWLGALLWAATLNTLDFHQNMPDDIDRGNQASEEPKLEDDLRMI
ncbi:hypothetical protein NDU88_001251 [Pleurodeles waltl]|uniref:Secreted protein n=1 Tax=Pleurodeles waltl TaxID=8319 RepID=A0AAV7WHS6_PLEWA|nr:hypothetical protein NDU88_001251 [Pleurodeles waltl]